MWLSLKNLINPSSGLFIFSFKLSMCEDFALLVPQEINGKSRQMQGSASPGSWTVWCQNTEGNLVQVLIHACPSCLITNVFHGALLSSAGCPGVIWEWGCSWDIVWRTCELSFHLVRFSKAAQAGFVFQNTLRWPQIKAQKREFSSAEFFFSPFNLVVERQPPRKTANSSLNWWMCSLSEYFLLAKSKNKNIWKPPVFPGRLPNMCLLEAALEHPWTPLQWQKEVSPESV